MRKREDVAELFFSVLSVIRKPVFHHADAGVAQQIEYLSFHGTKLAVIHIIICAFPPLVSRYTDKELRIFRKLPNTVHRGKCDLVKLRLIEFPHVEMQYVFHLQLMRNGGKRSELPAVKAAYRVFRVFFQF